MRSTKGFKKGFTLVELLIVVAILGIIAAIGYPAYVSYIQKTKRGEAQAALASFAEAMERHRSMGNKDGILTYDGAVDQNGVPQIFSTEAPLDGREKYYDLTGQVDTATNSFVVTATAKNGQEEDRQSGVLCSPLTLGSDGEKTPVECWK